MPTWMHEERTCICSDYYGPNPDCGLHGQDAYYEALIWQGLTQRVDELDQSRVASQMALDNARQLIPYLPMLHEQITMTPAAEGALVIESREHRAHLSLTLHPVNTMTMVRDRFSATLVSDVPAIEGDLLAQEEANFDVEVAMTFLDEHLLPGEADRAGSLP